MWLGQRHAHVPLQHPPQPLMQPRLPLLPDRDAVAQIAIEEDLLAVLDEPSTNLTGQRHIRPGVAHEHLGHITRPTTDPS
jgi:hypothetical protein